MGGGMLTRAIREKARCYQYKQAILDVCFEFKKGLGYDIIVLCDGQESMYSVFCSVTGSPLGTSETTSCTDVKAHIFSTLSKSGDT
jgi:hypothetical protein